MQSREICSLRGGRCVVKLTARLRTAPLFPARTFALAAPNANPAAGEDFACEGDRSFWAVLRLRAYVRLSRTQPLRHAAMNARFEQDRTAPIALTGRFCPIPTMPTLARHRKVRLKRQIGKIPRPGGKV